VNELLRVHRSKENARQAYNRISQYYDWLSGSSEERFRRTGMELLDASVGETILEIGYGTGHSVLDLAMAVGDSGRVLGIDISDGMRTVAMERIRRAELQSRVTLECGDGLALPYAACSVDAVFFCFTLELFDTPELPAVLGECRRVLKHGGRICVVAMSKLGRQGPMSRLYKWAHQRFPNYIDCRPIYAEKLLETDGFTTTGRSMQSMWGLPIEIVLSHRE
jgi:ubiquinone/menaquinone biosynthesis C-methylase UbiE